MILPKHTDSLKDAMLETEYEFNRLPLSFPHRFADEDKSAMAEIEHLLMQVRVKSKVLADRVWERVGEKAED